MRARRPASLSTPSRGALRDPSLRLAYWLPGFQSYADLIERDARVEALGGRLRQDRIRDIDEFLDVRRVSDGVSAARPDHRPPCSPR